MFCPKCGNKQEENAKFCANCGADLNGNPKQQTKPVDDEIIKKHKTNTNIGVGVGLLISAIGGNMNSDFGGILALIGYGMFIWGCIEYAEYKGYTWKMGLLGLLSVIGLIIMVCLPNKNKKANA